MEPDPTPPLVAAQPGHTTTVVKKPVGDAFSNALRKRWKDLARRKGMVTIIEPETIRKAVGSSDYVGDEAAAVATLWHLSSRLSLGGLKAESIVGPGVITLADIAAYERAVAAPQSPAHKKALEVRHTFEESKEKIAAAARDSYALWGVDAQKQPVLNPFGVQQGSIGDCYFLAALISLAHHDPKRIVDSIQKTKGGYRVRLFDGGKAQMVSVAKPTDAEFALFATTSGTGIWLPVMEKALGATTNASKILPKHDNDVDAADDDSPFEPFWTFRGNLAEGMEVVTGSTTTAHTLISTLESTTHEKLVAAFRPARYRTGKARAVTASIRIQVLASAWKWLTDKPTDLEKRGFQDMHAYSVVDYDEAKRVVVVQNPHGTRGYARGKKEWLPKLPLTEFDSIFTRVCYEDAPKAP